MGRALASIGLLALSGCVFDLPPPLEADGCEGEPVPCGSRCIEPEVACEPVDVEGEYTGQLRAEANGCMLESWEEGSTGAVMATFTRDGDEVTIEVGGIAGLLLSFGFGGDPVFLGTLEGDRITASLRGTSQTVEGNCAWSFRAELEANASLSGDSLEGTIRYRAVTNEHPDCPPYLAECVSRQSLSAVRAPGP